MESKELFFSTIGQDSHRFLDSTTTEGVGIILGGVSIPFERKWMQIATEMSFYMP